MKKVILFYILSLITLPTIAAQVECAYSPLQQLVRDARDANQISNLISSGIQFDEKVRCGGTLLQLAVRRGNYDVLKAILAQEPSRAAQMVSLDAFPIPNAPKQIPLLLFTAYYAPNENIMSLIASYVNIAQTDTSGRNVLWYMEKNPVLRSTTLYDNMNNSLLKSLLPSSPSNYMPMPLNQANNTPGALSLPQSATAKATPEQNSSEPNLVE